MVQNTLTLWVQCSYIYIGDSSACCRLVAWEKDIDSQVKQTCLDIREEILSEMVKVTVVNIESPETEFF